MKKLFVVAASCGLLFCHSNIMAQNERKCGHQAIVDALMAKDPQFEARFQQYKEDTKAEAAQYTQASAAAKTTATPLIPIVFHIVLNSTQLAAIGGAAGVEARAISQVAQLNRDFNRGNGDSTGIPAGFKPLYANANIRFSLAHRNPSGASTPGWEIITTPNTSFPDIQNSYPNAKHTSNGGADAWDATKYLNVWVINPDAGGLLGITAPPAAVFGFPTGERGIVLNFGAFGVKSGTGPGQYYLTGFTGGRTLTHEMGHYFEIWHLSGDDNGACPSGAGGHDDGIADTPPQADNSSGVPVYPLFDVCTASGNGIMFMNYMDYADDVAMHMFTLGQVAVMTSKVNGESVSLTQHPELTEWPTGVATVAPAGSFNITPNPATDKVTISFNSGLENLKAVSIFNMMGQEVKTLSLQGQNGVFSVNVSDLSKGMYFVKCRFDDETISQKLLVQ